MKYAYKKNENNPSKILNSSKVHSLSKYINLRMEPDTDQKFPKENEICKKD